jgi:predicted RNA-binding protein YlxR (DUF448 family)
MFEPPHVGRVCWMMADGTDSLAHAMGDGLDVRLDTRVRVVRRGGGGLVVVTDDTQVVRGGYQLSQEAFMQDHQCRRLKDKYLNVQLGLETKLANSEAKCQALENQVEGAFRPLPCRVSLY